ncbi:penicillin-binding protein [Thermoactinomyces daqus]|uniref:Penicillin-binding protein n=1 Tax=Thermoactinomyces daqus TaxID=1329516 RepID=A0A7W2AJD5_9BACL|nr:transglycosylase domain-containing protein [Thermoactinomyces daqus]MBA4543674.1 penicillin-binding protein [Thermoactinomyces daqus]
MKDSQSSPSEKETKWGKSKIVPVIKRVALILLASVSIIAVAVIGVGTGVFSAFAKNAPVMTKKDYDKYLTGWSQTSYAYFRDNKPIGYMVTKTNSKLIKNLNQVSPNLIDALISTEDREFWTHNGIVPKSIARAAIQQVIGSDVQTGGSTLTQQLVKNKILDDRSKNYERKTMEIIDAIRLEKYYSKDEILVKYLNSVEFGPDADGKRMTGFAVAAKGLFNTDIKDLDIPQAAYLAGMVQSPYAYNPFYAPKDGDEEAHLKAGTARMKYVLGKMLENKVITKEQYDEAIHYDVAKHLAKKSSFHNGFADYPYIINAVTKEAAQILQEKDKKAGIDKPLEAYNQQVTNGGYKIYTTIDQKMYDAVNDAVAKMHMPSKKINGKRVKEQVGATLIDNKTGGILAFVGGTHYDWLNRSLDTQRQPGSSIKPLLVYGPALNEGIISPTSQIVDEKIYKPDGSPYRNANGKYHNAPVTATYALQWSLNIPAIKIIRKLGVEHGFEYLRKMDINPNEKYDGEASALGGFHDGFSVTQMTGGYAMIANNGVFNKPHLIDKIIDSEGHVVYDYARDNKPVKVFSPAAVSDLRGMMRQVVAAGTAQMVGNATSGYEVIGKTGTTSSEKDVWFIGATPEISLGVWTGFDQPATVVVHDLSMMAWNRIFKAAAQAQPSMIPKGSKFKSEGSVPFQCFECNRQPAQPQQGGQQSGGQQGGGAQPPANNPAVPNPGQNNPAQPPSQNPGTQQPPSSSQPPTDNNNGGQGPSDGGGEQPGGIIQ